MSEAINARLLTGAGNDVRALVVSESARMPRDAGLLIIAASLTHDSIPALERYRGPKLAVVTPDADNPNDLHRLVSDLPHEVIEGTSHWMQLDRPDKFNGIVDRFLERVGASSGS
jgi:pimeloyl-ACP methyl ester carboxylesterase